MGKSRGVVLAVRVGIATGPVVVGDIIGEDAAAEAAVVGETPNLAARLQGMAQPNQVVIAALTHELVGTRFEYQDLGMHDLKGISEPVPAWRVVAERDAESRTAARRSARGRAPLVGRQEEIGLLMRAWETARDGRGQVILVNGEPGIGKSALVEVLRAEISDSQLPSATFRCSPYHTNSAYYPVIEHLKRASVWQSEDSAGIKLEKLEKLLASYDFDLEQTLPLYAALLSVPLPEARYAHLGLLPEQQKQLTQDALVALTLEEAERQPFLEIWEDVHWADPSTLELLGLFVEQAPTASFLMVLTFRAEFTPPWPQRSHVIPITLNRLERAQVEALIERLAGGKALPAKVVQHILDKTDGVPLYVEEMTKGILQSNVLREESNRYTLTGPLSEVSIPATLQDSLMARLDRLPAPREVAQLAAVLGREFSYEMLRGLVALDEPALRTSLAALVDAELLYQRGRPPRARYIFKHALVQDAAYQSLLKRTRRRYHQQVADMLEARFPETVETQPEVLAHHYTEAGSAEAAVRYWFLAGRLALRRSANIEAIAHLKRGLEESRGLPDTPERARMELDILTALGPAVIAAKGYGAPEVTEVYARGKTLCDRVGNKSDLFPVLRGLWNSYLFAGDMHRARERADELVRLAEDIDDPALVVEACRVMGTVSFFMGDFAGARDQVERGLELYDPERHPALAFVYGADPGVVCKLYGSLSLWMLGYPQRARDGMDAALARARELAHGHSESFALCYRALLGQLCRDTVAVRESAEAADEVASKLGIKQWLAWGTILRGWVLAMDGKPDEGIAELERALEGWRATYRLAVPYFLGLKAEALLSAGRLLDALDVLAEAGALAQTGTERFHLAELHRLKGVCLLQDERADEAEVCLQQALEVARAQQATALELRAAVSLARLWRRQGKGQAAQELLGEVYDRFTPGRDTVDGREARALLEELAASERAAS